MGQTGAVGLGSIPFVQPQLPSLLITFGSWAMIVIGTSCHGGRPTTLEGWWSPRA